MEAFGGTGVCATPVRVQCRSGCLKFVRECRFVLTDSGVHWVWKLDEVTDGEGEEEEDVLKTDAAWAMDRACKHGLRVSISSKISVCERDILMHFALKSVLRREKKTDAGLQPCLPSRHAPREAQSDKQTQEKMGNK